MTTQVKPHPGPCPFSPLQEQHTLLSTLRAPAGGNVSLHSGNQMVLTQAHHL